MFLCFGLARLRAVFCVFVFWGLCRQGELNGQRTGPLVIALRFLPTPLSLSPSPSLLSLFCGPSSSSSSTSKSASDSSSSELSLSSAERRIASAWKTVDDGFDVDGLVVFVTIFVTHTKSDEIRIAPLRPTDRAHHAHIEFSIHEACAVTKRAPSLGPRIAVNTGVHSRLRGRSLAACR